MKVSFVPRVEIISGVTDIITGQYFSENDGNREFALQSSSTLIADFSRTKTNFSKNFSKPFSRLQNLAIKVKLL